MTVFISYIIYRQLDRINKDNSILNQSQQELKKIIYIDELTGLASRRKISEMIQQMTSTECEQKPFSIMFIDMDNFKLINDTLGHSIGDLFLQESVHNISHYIKPEMTLGRMGGDEFLLIIPGKKTDEELKLIAEKIRLGITQPFVYENKDYTVTCSIGIARYPEDAKNDSEILQFADMALYEAKKQGKDLAVLFNQRLRYDLKLASELHSLIEDLDNGIEVVSFLDVTPAPEKTASEFYLVYQPQFKTDGKTLRGYEVLSRLKTVSDENISPTVFIPLLEKTGDIIKYGRWVLRQSIHDYQTLHHNDKNPPLLSVNFSTVQFRSSDFLENIKSIIDDTGMDPHNLEIEITESVIMYSPQTVIQKLQELHNMGIKLALDDFGTGYSSLSYLRLLPFDLLKIDKSFVDPIPDDKIDVNLVKAIIDLSHRLNIEVIAECVEKKEQFELLKKLECDFIQGYYLARPLPIRAL